MPSKFSLFAQSTRSLEEKAKNANLSAEKDAVPDKEKNPDDLDIK